VKRVTGGAAVGGDVVLSFQDVRKIYRGGWHAATIREDLSRVARFLTGRAHAIPGEVRALDGVSFEVRQGESFALIGDNGAGKTTALKLTSRITYPTSGRIQVRGRVGALIEVGTGLHPELTGRENIQLYGRILGLSGQDIARRFDEIIAFADIGSALEMPVKRYSTGMQLRLGFSVASHLEPELLLVDEALAVGDMGFRHRCVERMGQLVREGRTLVFISHDMSAVEALCQRALLLERGNVIAEGAARDVVKRYLTMVEDRRLTRDAEGPAFTRAGLDVVRMTLHSETGVEVEGVRSGEPMAVRLHFRASRPIARPMFSIGISEGGPVCLAFASMVADGEVPDVIEGEGFVECVFEELPLRPRTYELWAAIRADGHGDVVGWQRFRLFSVQNETQDIDRAVATSSLTWPPVKLPYRWRLSKETSSGRRSEVR
jgi:lipopolysaccharide transport system ATP-binding protein